MSMVHCSMCERVFDSANDPDCSVYVGNYKRLHKDVIMCESCRDDNEIDMDQQDAERAKGEAIAEKVDAKMKEQDANRG